MEKIVLQVHQEAEGRALQFSQFERFLLFTPPFSPLKGSKELNQVFHL